MKIREIVSKTIQMEELARLVLERSLKSVNAQAGYLAVKKNGSSKLMVAASAGMTFGVTGEIDLDPGRTLKH